MSLTYFAPDPYIYGKRNFKDRNKLGHGDGEMIPGYFSQPNVTISVLTSEKRAERDWKMLL